MARTPASPDPFETRLLDPPRVRRSVAPGPATSWTTVFALLFLVASFLALALWPAYVGRDLARIEGHIENVLEPAQELLARVDFAQARQLAAIEGFLLSGEERFRERWQEARDEERVALHELSQLVLMMSLQTREVWATFFDLTFDWYLDHQDSFSREPAPLDTLQADTLVGPTGRDQMEWLDAEQELYGEILSASSALETALASALSTAEGLRVDSLEGAQSLLSQVDNAQVKQMTALQSYLLTRESRYRDRYLEGQGEEEFAMNLLVPISEGLGGLVRTQAARFSTLSSSWHEGHQEVLSLEPAPEELPADEQERVYLQLVEGEQEAYEEILSLSSTLKEALEGEMEVAEAEIDQVRAVQTQVTRGLVLLGLLATGVVLLLGWNLRRLMRLSETRRQEALRARREADAILASTGDGVVGMDRSGRCIFLNRAGSELLGYPSRLAVGRDVHDLLHHSRSDGSPYPREECPIVQALGARESISGMNEVLWRAGREPFPVQISLRAVMDGPVLKGAVMTFADITEARAAEESLRQAVQARDEVLAVVSHDLRNPVGTIFSAASLLLELELAPEKRREQLESVKRSAERMNRLIQDLLDVARMEAGALSVEPKRFRVEELLEEVAQSHTGRADKRGIRIRTVVQPGAEEGWGDGHRLLQVLSNLVENALRYSPAAAEVVVRVEGDPQGEGLRFSVADHGPGISPEDKERLFDRFWQVSRKDKRGAGLGLAIARGLVEAHGGTVGVESEVGAGSVFWFFLPGEPAP
jgi:PAS domain S-box-containing protein